MSNEPSPIDQAHELALLIESGEARALRLKNRMSLVTIAQEVHVSAVTVLKWEQGRLPRGGNVDAYLSALRKLQGYVDERALAG